MAATKTFVLKLTMQCQCQGCQRKLKNLLQKIDGVHSTSIDPNQGMVTITGTVDPQRVVNNLEKQYRTEVLLFSEQSPQMDNQHNNKKQITVQPQSQKPVVEEFDDQNLVAQMHQFGGIRGLKHAEVTYSKTTKFTFNDNKDDELQHGGGVNNLYSSGSFPPPPELPPQESDYGPSAPPSVYGYPYTFEENPNRCTLNALLLSLNLGFAIFLFFFFRQF
ncbi:unnamed protein product [Camellia sinensis]